MNLSSLNLSSPVFFVSEGRRKKGELIGKVSEGKQKKVQGELKFSELKFTEREKKKLM